MEYRAEVKEGRMQDIRALASEIHESSSQIRGTLRIWGDWFGKPYDNVHQLIRCEAKDDSLRLYFEQGELLTLWSPYRIAIAKTRFEIGDAARVRWEWFYYGREMISENFYYMDYEKHGNK